MNMHEVPATPAGASPEVFQQLGLITRQLHDTLNQLGVMPKLQQSAAGLSDARSRLGYIARKTGEAAEKVLNSVDQAKSEHEKIFHATRLLAQLSQAQIGIRGKGIRGKGIRGKGAKVGAAAATIETAALRIEDHLTNIMLAQDFHDLTGQVVAKVVALAIDLEDSLVKLLVKSAPSELARQPEPSVLAGPVIDPNAQPDVVANQGEVDDLLASLGF